MAILILAVAALGYGSWRGYVYYQSLPKPRKVTVTAQPIPVTRLKEPLEPPNLVVTFSDSVAPLSGLHKPVLEGVTIDPPVRGAWRWDSDRQLTFRPMKDWPAETTYRISIQKNALPSHILLDRYSIDATTAKFGASFKKLAFYQDPTNPLNKEVVATLEFTHGVDEADLKKNLSLKMIGDSKPFKPGAPPFTLEVTQHQRVAYVHSAPLSLPEREDFMKVLLSKELTTVQGGAKLKADLEDKVRIPDLYSFFHIDSVKGEIITNKEGDPEQFLIVETSAAAKPEDVAKGLEVYLLPQKKQTNSEGVDEQESKRWESPREVDADFLKEAKPIEPVLVPAKQETTNLHTFKIKLEADGDLYVKVRKGVTALGDFVLGSDYDAVLPVPQPPADIEIQGTGGLLALNGERKLTIKSRGVRQIQYEIARVPADQINHLVSQTRGEFQNPEFRGYSFGVDNIARIATEKQSIAMKSRFKTDYSAFDFASHLKPATDGGSPMQGLFFLTAKGWDPEKNKALEDLSTRRFILVTDIGILVKVNADGSRDVFLQSIKQQEPLAGVRVEILAKNGVPCLTGTTSFLGRVTFPSLGEPDREKKPVAIVARNGNDVAFIPFSRDDRRLDFSRFDIDGIESPSGEDLESFVFTERGVYRPGDEVHVGFTVKQRNWGGKLAGLPLEVEVKDSRDQTVMVKKMALPEGGFGEFTCQTAYESPTGGYDFNVYLVRKGVRGTLLGSTSALLKEFLPDRMKIESHLMQDGKEDPEKLPAGWVNPKGIHAAVTLRNLYGTAASDRRIVGKLILSPSEFKFPQYSQYTFFDRLSDSKGHPRYENVELGEQKTDSDGNTRFDLDLERFVNATYQMTFHAEGFEAEGGRSVNSQNSIFVSALPYVVGYKADCDLNYVPMGSEHAIDFIALDPGLQKKAVGDLEIRITERNYLSVLVKQSDGTWAYESVLKEHISQTDSVSITDTGLQYHLPTANPGNFTLDVREKGSDVRLSHLCFSVVGKGEVSRALDKNAELEVKLARKQYSAGEEIELNITSPYPGSGLITMEREKVYAHQWFKAGTTNSVQRIRIPEGFDGTGYVNVSFIRSLDSKEIFMSPLSYSVIPFTANLEKRRLKVDLSVAPLAKPGEPLRIRYKTDRPSKIVIYAVDQGILQVTGYKVPDPLAYCFRKTALLVKTSQIVDLLLPEFSLVRSAAFGGDGEEGRHLNPFKRVTEKPVVFWSGVINADTADQEVVYNVPDYFNGTLTVMAVAAAPDAVGSVQQDSTIRGPFVITPGAPTLAAPGDQFEVGVTVANNVVGSGSNAKVTLTTDPSEHLEVVQGPSEPLTIPEGRETSVILTVKAKEKLGSASLTFTTSGQGDSVKLRSTLSVRPPVPLMTDVRSGNFTKEQFEVPIERKMYPEYRHLNAVVSALPLGLAHGLDSYLKNYPNGCSEQITSGAFCRLLLANEADFGLSRAEVFAQLEKTFAILRRRQNDQGAFGYWAPGGDQGIDFLSAYVMHFMVEAKEAGFNPPQDVFQSGLRNLQKMVVITPHDLREARTIAYAIYVLTREEVITTNYILNLRDFLDKKYGKQWQNDLAGVYLAGALAMLKDTQKAQELIGAYQMGVHDQWSSRWWSDFYQPLGADSQYLAMLARHFPERLKNITANQFQSIAGPVGQGHFNTLTAAYAVLALKSYSQHLSTSPVVLSISELKKADGTPETATDLPAEGKLLKRASFDADASAIRFSAQPQIEGMGAFWQVIETGFDLNLPDKPVTDGMEIWRELVDQNGKTLNDTTNPAHLGQPVTVRLRIRTINHAEIPTVAIMDLIPGGFEIVGTSLHPGTNSADCEYVDVREDRAVFFTSADSNTKTISYQIKPCNRGTFVVPCVFAESMYDRTLKARGLGGKIQVVEAK